MKNKHFSNNYSLDALADIENQIAQLESARGKLSNRIRLKEKAESASAVSRKARARRLIQTSALTEKYLETRGMTPEQIEAYLASVARADGVREIIGAGGDGAVSPVSAEPSA